MRAPVQSSNRTKVILFDVSGVLLELGGGPTTLLTQAVDPWAEWSESVAVRSFETGKIGADQFVARLIEEMALDEEPEELYREFASWPRKLHPEAIALIQVLRSNGYRVATLSNTNPVHWPLVLEMGLGQHVRDHFPSHQTGQLKPDLPAFRAVLVNYKCKPKEVLFFDDQEANVNAAKSLGIRAHTVRTLEDVLRSLSIEQILPSDTLKQLVVRR